MIIIIAIIINNNDNDTCSWTRAWTCVSTCDMYRHVQHDLADSSGLCVHRYVCRSATVAVSLGYCVHRGCTRTCTHAHERLHRRVTLARAWASKPCSKNSTSPSSCRLLSTGAHSFFLVSANGNATSRVLRVDSHTTIAIVGYYVAFAIGIAGVCQIFSVIK